MYCTATMITAVMTSAVLRLVIKDVLSTLDLIPFILHQKQHYIICPFCLYGQKG